MKLYPVMLNMAGMKTVVVGGGKVAYRKAEDLVDSGAHVKIVAPELLPDFKKLLEDNHDKITVVIRKYESGDLDGALVAFSATGDSSVNALVCRDAKKKNILVNSVDDPENCGFFVPSYARRGDFILAVSTGGTSPALAAKIRRGLESHLPEDLELMLEVLSQTRAILKKNSAKCNSEKRGSILKEIVSDDKKTGALLDHYKKGGLEPYVLSLLCSE